MKQLYFGNELARDGYKILACSEGIPGSVKSIMAECAVKVNPDRECGMVMLEEGAVLYMTETMEPRLALGEQRTTFFAHQYYISGKELDDFVENMPKALCGMRFSLGYADRYDAAEKALPSGDVRGKISPAMKKSAKEAAANGYKMIIHAQGMTSEKAMELMAKIAQELSNEERRRAGFILTNNAKDKRIERAEFVFCDASAANAMADKFVEKCIRFDADSDREFLSYDLQMKREEEERKKREEEERKQREQEGKDKEEETMKTEPVKESKVPSILSVIAIILAVIAIACSVVTNLRLSKMMAQEEPTEATEEVTETTEVTEAAEPTEKTENDENPIVNPADMNGNTQMGETSGTDNGEGVDEKAVTDGDDTNAEETSDITDGAIKLVQ